MISWHPTREGNWTLVDESNGSLRILGRVDHRLGLWYAKYLGTPLPAPYESAEQARWTVDMRLIEDNSRKEAT